MQMALPSALRYFLLCFLARALLAPGFSLRSSLSQAVTIPDDSRVTTVNNIESGVGVVRPPTQAPPATEASGSGDTGATTATGSGSSPMPGGREWKIEAMFEMSSTAPLFMDEYDSNLPGFALTLADRLKWATDVPLSRFAFFFPGGAPVAGSTAPSALFCECNKNEAKVGAVNARFAAAKNASFICNSKEHVINATVGVALLQTRANRAISFEVGLYPASGVGGDTKPAIQVAEDVVRAANGEDEPVRKLQRNGLWTYKAGDGVRFHGLFPATLVSMPGASFAKPRETSLALGPNPGGQGAEPPPTVPPDAGKKEQAGKNQEAYFADVDTVVSEATKINTQVKNSLQELKDSLARASAVHNAWMNTDVYQLPKDLVG